VEAPEQPPSLPRPPLNYPVLRAVDSANWRLLLRHRSTSSPGVGLSSVGGPAHAERAVNNATQHALDYFRQTEPSPNEHYQQHEVLVNAHHHRCIAVYSSSQGCHTATGTHMPHGITQCYLPPGRADIPALTPAEAVLD